MWVEQLRRQHRGAGRPGRAAANEGFVAAPQAAGVTQRDTNGKAFVFVIRKAKLPKPQIGCLAPGSNKLNRSC